MPFVGFILFRSPTRNSFWVSFPIALLRLGFLFLDRKSGFEPSHFLFLEPTVLWAISVALARSATASVTSSAIAVAQLFITGTIILAVSAVVEDFPAKLPSALSFGWFSASVILSTCRRFVLQFEGQRGTAPAQAALLMIFEPVWAMIFAFVFFDTSVSMMQAIGCAVIFAAVAGDALTQSAPKLKLK